MVRRDIVAVTAGILALSAAGPVGCGGGGGAAPHRPDGAVGGAACAAPRRAGSFGLQVREAPSACRLAFVSQGAPVDGRLTPQPIVVASLDLEEHLVVAEMGFEAHFTEAGRLVYLTGDGRLMVRPVEGTGEPILLAEGVAEFWLDPQAEVVLYQLGPAGQLGVDRQAAPVYVLGLAHAEGPRLVAEAATVVFPSRLDSGLTQLAVLFVGPPVTAGQCKPPRGQVLLLRLADRQALPLTASGFLASRPSPAGASAFSEVDDSGAGTYLLSSAPGQPGRPLFPVPPIIDEAGHCEQVVVDFSWTADGERVVVGRELVERESGSVGIFALPELEVFLIGDPVAPAVKVRRPDLWAPALMLANEGVLAPDEQRLTLSRFDGQVEVLVGPRVGSALWRLSARRWIYTRFFDDRPRLMGAFIPAELWSLDLDQPPSARANKVAEGYGVRVLRNRYLLYSDLPIGQRNGGFFLHDLLTNISRAAPGHAVVDVIGQGRALVLDGGVVTPMPLL